MENQDQPRSANPENQCQTDTPEEKEIREVRIASNKNHLCGRIYYLSSKITDQRVKLKEFDGQKVRRDVELKDIKEELKVAENSLEGLTGKELYDAEKESGAKRKRKDVEKLQEEVNQFEKIIEKTEDVIDNFEVQCIHCQEELEDAIEYEQPTETEAKPED